MQTDATVHRWSELPEDHPLEKISRRRLVGEKAMLAQVSLERGCRVPAHAHENEQFTCILDGKLRFWIGEEEGGEEMVLGPGEVIHFPSNVFHGAEALEDTRVIDVFSPPSAHTGLDQDAERG
jgi:quercetin dioxygenase-like cupin family protein